MSSGNILAKLIREATKPKSIAEQFEYAFYCTQQKMNPPRMPKKDMFSPSSLGGCARQLYYKVQGIEEEPDNRPPSEAGPNLSMLQTGTDRHERIQQIVMKMKENGFDIEWVDPIQYLEEHPELQTQVIERQGNEVKLYNDIISARFLCDGIVKIKGVYYIIEIKTMGNYKWTVKYKEVERVPYEEHQRQGGAYSIALGIDNILYVYENRDNLKLLPIEFFVDGQVKQDVIGEIENVKTYQKLEQLPPRTIKISKCKYCHYKNRCGNDGFTPDLTKVDFTVAGDDEDGEE